MAGFFYVICVILYIRKNYLSIKVNKNIMHGTANIVTNFKLYHPAAQNTSY